MYTLYLQQHQNLNLHGGLELWRSKKLKNSATNVITDTLNSSTSPDVKKKIEHDFILQNNSDLSKYNSNFNNKSENINFQNVSRFTKH